MDQQRYPALLEVSKELQREWSERNLLGNSADETLMLVAENEGRKQAIRQFFQRIEEHANG